MDTFFECSVSCRSTALAWRETILKRDWAAEGNKSSNARSMLARSEASFFYKLTHTETLELRKQIETSSLTRSPTVCANIYQFFRTSVLAENLVQESRGLREAAKGRAKHAPRHLQASRLQVCRCRDPERRRWILPLSNDCSRLTVQVQCPRCFTAPRRDEIAGNCY